MIVVMTYASILGLAQLLILILFFKRVHFRQGEKNWLGKMNPRVLRILSWVLLLFAKNLIYYTAK